MSLISPAVIDLILIAVAVEFIVIGAVLKKASLVRFIAPLFFFLISGGLLLFALRAALSAMETYWIAGALLGALITHGVCLLTLFKNAGKTH